MPSRSSARTIEQLKQRIVAARLLLQNSPINWEDLSRWEDSTRACFARCFSKRSDEYHVFIENARHPHSMTLPEWQRYYIGNVKLQIQHIQACIDVTHGDKKHAVEIRRELMDTLATGASNDPLKRRYQVFVSSTYDDLKEERRHVMQALLQTKCIPTGMELFPAASEDKWELIKHVIDDCDYYIVIVAGRYGSLGPQDMSFTEMEFDYAVSSGKSVMGFYHSDTDSLPVGKSEKTDSGRQHLVEFIKKVKKVRSCAGWNTPEGLGSAIKTAIINAIENDPKPGWVRATSLPSAAAIASLKDSIQSPDSQQKTTPASWGQEILEIPARIGYSEIDNTVEKKPLWPERKSIQHTFRKSLNELFLILGSRMNEKKHRQGLKVIFQTTLADESESLISGSEGKNVTDIICRVDMDLVDKILQTFLAYRLLKRVPPPPKVRLKDFYWQITPRGIQKVGELKAFTALGRL